jgi:anthranilate synthase/aminodeoxychorismate synthase-like glutamine amidotransferase
VYGGVVNRAPAIVHGKTSQMQILDACCPLFQGLSNPFEAMRYHSLVVESETLPDCFTVTCRDLTHDLIMGLQHNTLPLYGVQFHPESIGTPEGPQLLKNFLTLTANQMNKGLLV